MTSPAGRAPGREILGRMRIADERRVIAADECAVERRAHAFVGLRYDDDKCPTARSASTDSSVVSSNESGYRFWTRGSLSSGLSSGTIPHCSLPCARLSLECCTQTTGTSAARACRRRCRHWRRPVPLVGSAHNAVLHVDHEKAVFARFSSVVMASPWSHSLVSRTLAGCQPQRLSRARAYSDDESSAARCAALALFTLLRSLPASSAAAGRRSYPCTEKDCMRPALELLPA